MAFRTASAAVILLALPAALGQGLSAVLEQIVHEKAAEYNCSFGIALRMSDGSNPVAVAGDNSMARGASTQTKSTDPFVWGSITKVITGTAILRQHESGRLPSLDAKLAAIVDPLLERMARNETMKMNYTKLSELFGDEVAGVTVRHLATMRSGIPDFDTARNDGKHPTDSFRAQVLSNPDHDFIPTEVLALPWVAKGKLDFSPGSRFSYSTTNFVLLGLVLCASTEGCTTWDAYDQRNFATKELAARLKQTSFASHGDPADFDAVHGYDRTSYNGHDSKSLPGRDFWRVHGAFAGWTGSDVVMPVQDAAEIAYAVYAPSSSLLSNASQAIMQKTGGFGFYTFATMNLGFQTGQMGNPYGEAWGHLGATYGYDSTMLYYPALGFSMAIASNIETPTQVQVQDAACVAYNRIKNYLLNASAAECSIDKGSYFAHCSCGQRPQRRYKCDTVFHHKVCLPALLGGQSKDTCEKSCG